MIEEGDSSKINQACNVHAVKSDKNFQNIALSWIQNINLY